MRILNKMTLVVALATMAVVVLAVAAMGDEPTSEPTSEPTVDSEAQRLRMEPWRLEIREVRERTDEQLADLQEEYRQTEDPAEIRRIEREIRDLKQGIQVDIFEIQAAEARRQGDEDLATRFEAAIERLQEKPEKKEPVERHEVQPSNK